MKHQRADFQILPGRQVLVYGRRLDQSSDIRKVLPAPRMTVKENFPVCGTQDSRHHLKQCGLARSVRTQKSVHAALRYCKRNMIDGIVTAE